MIAAETMEGINGNKVYALPHKKLQSILKKYKRMKVKTEKERLSKFPDWIKRIFSLKKTQKRDESFSSTSLVEDNYSEVDHLVFDGSTDELFSDSNNVVTDMYKL